MMPLHNQTASTVAMARALRDGLDASRDQTSVRTATLRLLLDTLIELGDQPFVPKRSEEASRIVTAQSQSIARAQEAVQKVIEAEQAAAEARLA